MSDAKPAKDGSHTTADELEVEDLYSKYKVNIYIKLHITSKYK